MRKYTIAKDVHYITNEEATRIAKAIFGEDVDVDRISKIAVTQGKITVTRLELPNE